MLVTRRFGIPDRNMKALLLSCTVACSEALGCGHNNWAPSPSRTAFRPEAARRIVPAKDNSVNCTVFHDGGMTGSNVELGAPWSWLLLLFVLVPQFRLLGKS